MLYHKIYQSLLGCNTKDEVFKYFFDNLTPSNTTWDYFVNWDKIRRNLDEIEMDLNTLNYLVGKSNPKASLKLLLQQHPQLIRVLPILVAKRLETRNQITESIEILIEINQDTLLHQAFDFSWEEGTQLSSQQIDDACEFAEKTGVLQLFQSKQIKSVPDYVYRNRSRLRYTCKEEPRRYSYGKYC